MTLKSVTTLSIREQAEAEIRDELNKKNLAKMKDLVRQRETTKQVLAGIEAQIADLEQQIGEGTA